MKQWFEILFFFCCVLALASTGVSMKIQENWLNARYAKAVHDADQDQEKLRAVEAELAKERSVPALLKKIKEMGLSSEDTGTFLQSLLKSHPPASTPVTTPAPATTTSTSAPRAGNRGAAPTSTRPATGSMHH